jgi:hypothetical protein
LIRADGDPGDAIWTALGGAPLRGLKYDVGEDLELRRPRPPMPALTRSGLPPRGWRAAGTSAGR